MTSREEEQYELEESSDVIAASRRLNEMRCDAAMGSLELPNASKLIARAFIEVQIELEKIIATKAAGKVKKWLHVLQPEVAAIIALREVLGTLSKENSSNIQTLAINIGRLWELEVRIAEATKVNPMYMKKVTDRITESCTTDKRHIRLAYNAAYEVVMRGLIDSTLSSTDLIQLGKFGVQACMNAGLVYETHNTAGSPGDYNVSVQYWLSEDVHAFLTEYDDTDVKAIMDKAQGAMLCPPVPWTTLEDGGYLTPRRKLHNPFMGLAKLRPTERQRVREEFTAENMPVVFRAGNYLQSTAFALHKPTADAMLRLWRTGGGVLGVPNSNAPVRPVCPFPPEWVRDNGTPEELAIFRLWKHTVVQWYADIRTWRGRVRELSGHLRTLTQHEDHPIWFPMYMDTRGRWYYRGTPNPQGSDLSKACLHLHHKKELGPRGLFWLKVHIANSFGFDKERMQDRAKWTDDNWSTIEKALDEPENHPEVWGTDAPWCMFSAAWELREAYRSGNPTRYSTGIVIHMDATCSGLQHFSALLRDPVGAQCVNLTDELGCGPKQDIYSQISTLALRMMQQDMESDDPLIKEMATWWWNVGIPRKLAKKPTMTYVYGATLRGTSGFIRDYIETETAHKWPDELIGYKYAHYCAVKLFDGIAGTVPAAAYAMQWLKGVAQRQPKGKRMQWKTPTGFLVQHDYVEYNEKKVYLRSCGVVSVMVRKVTDGTDTRQMQNAIAPNFVHALDASHLTLTAIRMADAGYEMVGIHDSFGTHPCDVDAMHRFIREEFVDMYSNRNLLGEFLWDIQQVGDVPMRGTLNVQEVLESEFFFS